MRRALVLAIGLLLGVAHAGAAIAQTTTVRTDKDLRKLQRKSKLSGSWVIDMPGLQSISLPKLQEVEGRLDLATPGLVHVALPALERVGADLFVGCDAPPRQEWATLGPIRPLEQAAPEAPSPFAARAEADVTAVAATPAVLSLPALTRVGGGLAVCSPGLTGLEAPLLTDVGTDLQVYAGASWTSVSLPGLKRVRARVFGWIDGATLTVDLSGLGVVDGALQWGGHGALGLDLGALTSAAALIVTGSRRTSSGRSADTPSLTMTGLSLGTLERATQRFELRTLGGLTAVVAPMLERSDHVVLADLPDLERAALPALAAITGGLQLAALPSTATLDLAALRSVGGDVTVARISGPAWTLPPIREVGGSVVLRSVSVRVLRLSRLEQVGALRATDLGTLDLLDLPNLQSAGELVIEAEPPTDPGTSRRILSAPSLRSVPGMLRIAGAASSELRFERLAEAGEVQLVDLPALTIVQLPQLRAVTRALLVGGAPRLERLSLPSLVQAATLDLIALTGLKRLVAPRYGGELKQSEGTRVKDAQLGGP